MVMSKLEDQYDIAALMPDLERFASSASFILEIGTGHGNGSTRAFTKGIEESPQIDKLYISVEWQPAKFYERPNLWYWHLVVGDSRDEHTLFDVVEICEIKKADIIFIDTHHTYEQMQQELEVWKWLAGKNTRWLFHDTWMMGEYNHMTDAIKEFCVRNPGWEYSDYRTDSHGLGMMRYVGI